MPLQRSFGGMAKRFTGRNILGQTEQHYNEKLYYLSGVDDTTHRARVQREKFYANASFLDTARAAAINLRPGHSFNRRRHFVA
jgi:hypothetical protein